MSPADHSHIAAPGILFALTSALLFGASTPFAKLLLGVLDPWMLAGLLYLGSGLGLATLRIGRHLMGRPAAETPLRLADLPWLTGVVLVGGVIGPVLLMIGLVHTSASTGSLLLNLEGLATMAIAWLVFRENVDRRLLLGAFAILAGAVLLSWSGEGREFNLGWGALAIAGACLAWGIDNNLTRKLSAADPVQIALIKGLVAGTVNLILSLAQGVAPYPSFPSCSAPASSVSPVTVSVWFCLCWLYAISVRRAPEPIFQRRLLPGRLWLSPCLAILSHPA